MCTPHGRSDQAGACYPAGAAGPVHGAEAELALLAEDREAVADDLLNLRAGESVRAGFAVTACGLC